MNSFLFEIYLIYILFSKLGSQKCSEYEKEACPDWFSISVNRI